MTLSLVFFAIPQWIWSPTGKLSSTGDHRFIITMIRPFSLLLQPVIPIATTATIHIPLPCGSAMNLPKKPIVPAFHHYLSSGVPWFLYFLLMLDNIFIMFVLLWFFLFDWSSWNLIGNIFRRFWTIRRDLIFNMLFWDLFMIVFAFYDCLLLIVCFSILIFLWIFEFILFC